MARRVKANRAALRCLLILWVIWLLENLIGENNAWLGVLTYVPQFPLLFLPGVLLLLALLRREGQAVAVNGVGIMFWLIWGMGYVVPLHWPVRSTQSYAHLKVMTFNILGGDWGVERVAQVVKRENPDVVCFQEARDPDGGDLVAKLSKVLVGYHAARTREVATFSKFQIEAEKAVALPKETGRALLVTVLKIPGTGKAQFHRVRVVNVHLAALQISGLRKKGVSGYAQQINNGVASRERQRSLLTSATNDYLGNPDGVLVMGDFNTPPRGRLYRDLLTRWQDAFRSAGSGFGHTFSSRLPVVRIDYVWANKMFVVRRCEPVDPIARDSKGQRGYASDHLPLIAELDLMP